MFRDYDLVPTLLAALDGATGPHAALAAQTTLDLVCTLCDELAGGRDPSDRRDPQMIRRYVLGSLETAVHRFSQHQRREVIESFLLLAGPENVVLRQILGNVAHAAMAAIIDAFSKTSQRGILRLLLSFLDDPSVPSRVLNVIAGRGDARFVHYLMRKIGHEPNAVIAANLKKITSFAWLGDCRRILDQIDDSGQHSAIRLALASGVPRAQVLGLIENVLLHGKPGGRREAARALADFQGAEANALAMKGLADPDPQVQANIIPQLRGRGIPGVLPGLMEHVDSPYAVVRRAARACLSEFSFKRFAASFDMFDDDVRRSTAALVKEIDTQSIPLLNDELRSPIRTRRIRGLAIARAMDAVESVEDAVIALLQDEDHVVRVEAAIALASSLSPASIVALTAALNDKSEVVHLTAQRSLQETIQTHSPP